MMYGEEVVNEVLARGNIVHRTIDRKCMACGSHGLARSVFHFDNSAYEYSPIVLCRPCLNAALDFLELHG